MPTMRKARALDSRVLMLLISLIVFSIVSDASAQGNRGGMAITVVDTSGAVLPGAAVDIINQDTGVTERTVMTAEDGKVLATLLPAGMYRLVANRPGFNQGEVRDVRVRITETSSATVTLPVAGVTQEITVETAVAQVQLNSPSTGRTLEAETISRLPMATGNFFGLLTLSTGANTELFDTAALGRGAVTINVNGQRPTNNNYQLEGINANDFNLPILDNVPLPNPQTLAEFKTQTSLYDASQGRNGGGNVQVALKSGTSEYHGDAYEFFRNDWLNANDFFLNRAGRPRPILRQNKYGGSFGGPIPGIKNLFGYGNYQGTRALSGISTGTTISTNIPILPTDRSEANLTRTFFPSGLPPGFTRLDPVALRFLTLPASKCPGFNDGTFCLPSLSGTAGPTGTGTALRLANLTRSSRGDFNDDQFVVSIDHQTTQNDKITGRWFYADFQSARPFGITSSLAHQKDFPNANRFLKLGWTRIISPTMINESRFGFNRFSFSQIPHEPISLADIGATRGNSGEFPAAYRINILGSGQFSMGTGVNDDRTNTANTFTYADDLSMSRGKHQLRMGFEADRYQLNRANRFATRGSVTFGNTVAGAGGAGIPALAGFQNFLLGRITTTQGGSGIYTFYFRAADYSGYFQDDWRAASRLTLNLGVRWEGLSTAKEKRAFSSNFQGLGDGTPGPLKIIHPERTPRVGTPGVTDCTLLHCMDANNIAPRVGLAWDFLGNHKTVLRSGYGIYYQRTSNQGLLQTTGGLPFQEPAAAAPFSVTTLNPFPTSRPTSDFPLPTDQVVPRLIAFNATTGAPVFSSASGGALGATFFFPRRDFHAPYAQHWNLNIQQEVYRGWIAEVGYVGTRGVGLLGPGRPFNPAQICTVANPCAIPADIGANVTVPGGTPGITKQGDGTILITRSTGANADARVPALYLGLANNQLMAQEQAGQSTYHSLQASLTHQYSNGLYFQAGYTWSKAIDNSSGSSFTDELNGNNPWGDLFDTKSTIGLADFDRTHRFVVSYNYELPFARWAGVPQGGALGRVVHGWSINGVSTFQSGTPFMVYDSSAVQLEDTDQVVTQNKTILIGNVKDAYTSGDVKSRLTNYIDLSKFVVGGRCVDNQNSIVSCSSPASTGFTANGTLGRNVFRGPFQTNWDMSLIKSIPIKERHSVDLRAEFFNVWNHAAFSSPQASGANCGGSCPTYGLIDVSGGDSSILTTANRPRIIQFAVKYNF